MGTNISIVLLGGTSSKVPTETKYHTQNTKESFRLLNTFNITFNCVQSKELYTYIQIFYFDPRNFPVIFVLIPASDTKDGKEYVDNIDVDLY